MYDKAFNIAKNPNNDGCQSGILSMACIFFDEKTAGEPIKNEIMANKGLAEELHKPIIRKLKKGIVYSFFIDNIWVLMLLICNW